MQFLRSPDKSDYPFVFDFLEDRCDIHNHPKTKTKPYSLKTTEQSITKVY